MADDRDMLVPIWPLTPGQATVALYCDECGELYCDHRDEWGRYIMDDEPVDPA